MAVHKTMCPGIQTSHRRRSQEALGGATTAQEVPKDRLRAAVLEGGIRTEAESFRKLGRKSLGRMEDRELELRKKKSGVLWN